MGLSTLQGFHRRKILTLLDSSGNNLIVAERVNVCKVNLALENQSKQHLGHTNDLLENQSDHGLKSENQSIDVYNSQHIGNLGNQNKQGGVNSAVRKSNGVKPRLESQSNNDRNTTRRVRKNTKK